MVSNKNIHKTLIIQCIVNACHPEPRIQCGINSVKDPIAICEILPYTQNDKNTRLEYILIIKYFERIMKVKKFTVNPFVMNCYVYYDEQSKEGVIIDPGVYTDDEK